MLDPALSRMIMIKYLTMFTVRILRKYSSVTWLALMSCLLGWQMAIAANYSDCLALSDNSVCQRVADNGIHEPMVLQKHKNGSYLSAHLLAMITRSVDPLHINGITYGHSVIALHWQAFYDAPPTPPPESHASIVLA